VAEIDPEGRQIRSHKSIKRRIYDGEAPGHIWHIDTHHKIGQFGFVTFGAICGYTHQIIALKCAINNKALTLLVALKTSPGMLEHGLPNLIRGDAGMENVAIARLLNYINGERHFLIGRSVHNQRIERLWRDVFSNVIGFYHEFFSRLYETIEHNPFNTWILQYLFLDRINEDLSEFIDAWNSHSMSTVRGRSPDKQFLMALENRYRIDRQINDDNVRNIVQGLEQEYEGKKSANSSCPFTSEEELTEFHSLVEKLILSDNLLVINDRIFNAYTVASQIINNR